ncbi:TAXI family TRAP transporter solute-binding subunit [Halomonas sp. ISL-60]|uniref:TAXI family TRAP transporter solute-binding subunit n=1 Tax=unclassified Halomonas TaxID=2609666 RepID=UPI0007D9F7BA|nr:MULTISPECIES: TAXI family TRAP transporter solute-binding subunit [unclassified Halomonas]MBT2774934.1 TAXI family TRAP transporter solute-binding subunit [Halomonas sp. ISL-60]MBT2787822.1 TAXI family TRAP transporter solute-binding subunit [Halomonas sp. ISL-106]MBT2799442.1 TAXI family TRAP transporter solute-binding subunit [Halomonas sp. ISL-104]MBT2803978.1 TAXI family TRAP transporter solute-binding subunit [Halomonas sp. ISL-56]OAL61393.1 C4-dicarboxylate ABC transporter substrate-b
MRKHMPKTFTLLASSALLVAAASSAQAQDRSGWPDNFTVGTASQGGTYFVYGSGWANFIADELGVSGGGEVTGGPTQNLALVHTGDMAFGLTTMGPASDAVKGESPLAPGMQMDNVCAMFPMYETPFSIAALSSSGIESISDIPDGARIGFGPAASTSDTYFPAILETLGVNFDRRNGGWSDLGGQLQDGLLDVVAFAAGIPIPAVSQLEVQTDVNIIEFNEEELATVLENFPVAEFTIPASTYTTLEEDARAVSMWNFAIAGCDLPEDFVYEVTKATMENNDRMRSVHRSAETTIPENIKHNTVLPFHPGAARWYEENGYEIADDMIN